MREGQATVPLAGREPIMTANEIVEELRTLGSESIKKVLRNHGVQEPFFGVKIGDMKKIQKRIKKDYRLASTCTKPDITMPCIWPGWSPTTPR